MTISIPSIKPSSLVAQPFSFFQNSPSRKMAKMFSLLFITLLIALWTWFLHSYTIDTTLYIHSTTDTYPPSSQEILSRPDIDSITTPAAIAQSQAVILLGGLPNMPGHNKTEIQSLVDSVSLSLKELADITVILYYKASSGVEGIKKMRAQINSVLAQTIQPKHIWIVTSNAEKTLAEFASGSKAIQIKYLPHIEYDTKVMTVGDAPWLLHALEIPTAFTWILEPEAEIDNHYLAFTFGLMKTEEYKSSLVGYDTSLLPSTSISFVHPSLRIIPCSKHIETSHPVDMIHGSWLLKTPWIDILRRDITMDTAIHMPLAYFISSALLYRAGIPSMAVPSPHLVKMSTDYCKNSALTGTITNSVYPNALDHTIMRHENKHKSIALLLDGSQNAIAFLPLICKFQNYNVHIILTHGLTRITFEETIKRLQCPKNIVFLIYDLSSAYNNDVTKTTNKLLGNTNDYISGIDKLMELMKPQVLIHIKDHDSYFYYTVSAMAKAKGVTPIGLPKADIEHALWIADLPIQALRHWNDIKIDLVLITDRRPQSLSRLLASANNAYYFGDDEIEMSIHMEQSANLETRTLVQAYDFKHGHKKLRHRIRKGGLMPAIVESWYPSHNHNYGVLLEDDIELSPLFYSWSKYNILKYRYSGNEEAYKHIYGISLYSPRNLELIPEGRRPFHPEPVLKQHGFSERTPYATQIPCSWGAVYFPEHWLEFHTYLTERLEKEDTYAENYYNITVPGSRSERWKKSWKKYLIQLVYLRGYVMVYPNFQDFESFSTNHLEFGTHVKQKNNGRTQSKMEQFLVPLMQRDTILAQLPDQQLPDFEHLPIMDLWGRIRSLSDIEQVGEQWHRKVSACLPKKIGTFDPSDILCPFDENVVKSTKKKEKSS